MGIQNENRDLNDYLTHYYKLPFERTAERFWRRKLLETLTLLQPQSILEVGCGLNSIFADIDEKVCGTIIEPISTLLERQRHLQPRCKMHLYRKRTTDALDSFRIGWGIHYPIPLHLQPAYLDLGFRRGDFPISEALGDEWVSLPMFPGICKDEIETIVQVLKNSEE